MEDRFKYKILDTKNNKFVNMLIGKNDFELKSDGSFEQIYRGLIFDRPNIKDLKPIFCTGLKDKNGKLIYEGDLLNSSDNEILGVVEFGKIELMDMNSGIIIIQGWSCNKKHMQYFRLERYEIVGSIYFNSELLESK